MWNTTHYAVHIFEWGVLLVKPLVLEQEIPRGELHGMWYNAPTMLPAGGRQHCRCIIPQTVTHSLVLLKMGTIISRRVQ